MDERSHPLPLTSDRPSRRERHPAASRTGRAVLLVAGLAAVPVLLGPAPMRAQEAGTAASATTRKDSTATLVGKVVSAMTGGPLGGARVVMKASGYGAITDSIGNFRIPRIPAGFVDTIQVGLIGYAKQSIPLKIEPGSTTRAVFSLSQTVLRVEDLHVEVKRSSLHNALADFERDKKTGLGYFVTPQMIKEEDPTYASDILRRVPGVMVAAQVNGKSEVHIVRSNLNCYPTLYLDGNLWPGHNLDELTAQQILALEVYRGTSEIPPRFMGYGRPDCGVIVVWTKQGGDMDSIPAGGGD